jgi:hypothetical protein
MRGAYSGLQRSAPRTQHRSVVEDLAISIAAATIEYLALIG